MNAKILIGIYIEILRKISKYDLVTCIFTSLIYPMYMCSQCGTPGKFPQSYQWMLTYIKLT